MMLTETSIEGMAINREIWLESCVEHIKRLREEGVPMLGLIWWPMIDQIDWDGALTHRIGKVHEVGLFNLKRQQDGTLFRTATPLVKLFRQYAEAGESVIGKLEQISYPSPEAEEEQLPPIGEWIQPAATPQDAPALRNATTSTVNKNGNGHAKNGNGAASTFVAERLADAAPGLASAEAEARGLESTDITSDSSESKSTDRYGIVVFSHLRW